MTNQEQESKWRSEFESWIGDLNPNLYFHWHSKTSAYENDKINVAFQGYLAACKKSQDEIDKQFAKNKILAKEVAYKWKEVADLKNEIEKRDKLLDRAAIILKLFRHSDTQLGCCLCDNCQNISKWHSEVESECRIQKQKELK